MQESLLADLGMQEAGAAHAGAGVKACRRLEELAQPMQQSQPVRANS